MSLLSRHCLVSGRVQGVGYRVFVQDAAIREKVSGYVRNLVDGRVEIVLSGTMESVERVERLLQLGPVGSRVDRVDATEHAAEAFENAFEIRATTGRQENSMESLKSLIRNVPDFPKPGILFYDITTLLADGDGLRQSIDALANPYREQAIDLVVGIESRGFIFGTAVADRLGVGFVPVRKPGKLPSTTVRVEYELEYGTDALEMHDDAVRKGQRVLVVDDLLATGGTAKAVVDLLTGRGAEVHALAFLIELEFLPGRDKLSGQTIHSVLRY